MPCFSDRDRRLRRKRRKRRKPFERIVQSPSLLGASHTSTRLGRVT
jgi:hypothetical protein